MKRLKVLLAAPAAAAAYIPKTMNISIYRSICVICVLASLAIINFSVDSAAKAAYSGQEPNLLLGFGAFFVVALLMLIMAVLKLYVKK